ncbi:MAG: hypothetical protein MK106_08070 [Mariniblastus sp.]|nr:hypothetical protein [Mariniblastus sp.]
MDQLVPVIEFLKKNRFWLTCGILAAVMSGTWFFAAGQMDSDRKTNLADIKKRQSTHDTIMRTVADTGDAVVAAHPNESSKAGMASEIDAATSSVLKAWKMRYDAQAEIMTWPDEVDEKFVSAFSQFDPPETFPADKNQASLLSFLLIYNLQIPKTMNRICSIIGADWKYTADDKDAAPPMDRGREGDEQGRDGSSPESETSVVDENMTVVKWNEENQDLWHEKLTSFKGRDDHKLVEQVPSPSQVYMLQQDLWLLEAFFNIIKKVNGAADANDLATIKTIDHLAFGREALTQLGEISPPNVQLADAALTAAESEGNAPPDLSELEAEKRANRKEARALAADGESSTGLNYNNQPAYHGRYVNENFEPILADEVRKVISGTELPETNLELVVSKRVPVRFACRMDERKIPEFLTACYQWGQEGEKPSPFIFEVWQVRINRHIAGEGIELQGANAAVTTGGSSRQTAAEKAEELASGVGGGAGAGLEGGEADPNEAAGGSGLSRSEGIETRIDYDVDVEFYGIVKIYNPVNEQILTGNADVDSGGNDQDSDETSSNP